MIRPSGLIASPLDQIINNSIFIVAAKYVILVRSEDKLLRPTVAISGQPVELEKT